MRVVLSGRRCCSLQVIGVLLIAAGSWALTQKDNSISVLSNFFMSPVVLLLIAGCVIFAVGFFGCIGALRENICLLVLVSGKLFVLYAMT